MSKNKHQSPSNKSCTSQTLGALVTAWFGISTLTSCSNNSSSRETAGAESNDHLAADSLGGGSEQVTEPVATSGAFLAGNFPSFTFTKSADGTLSVKAPAGSVASATNRSVATVPISIIVVAKAKIPTKFTKYTKVDSISSVKSFSSADGSFSAKIPSPAGSVVFIQISSSLDYIRVDDIGERKLVSVAFDGDNVTHFTPLSPDSAALDLAKILTDSSTASTTLNAFQKRIAVGSSAGLLINAKGEIWAWGINTIARGSASFGVMPTDQRSVAAPQKMSHEVLVNGPGNSVSQAAQFNDVSAGDQFACAVETMGGVYCWGSNASAQLGSTSLQSSNGEGTSVPQRVPGPNGALQVSAGIAHACAVTQSGELWCWGRNTAGETGGSLPPSGAPEGSITNSPRVIVKPVSLSPAQKDSFSYIQVAAGKNFTCALGSDSHVYCFGSPADGVRGNQSTDSGGKPFTDTPISIAITDADATSEVGNFTRVTAGAHHVCAIDLKGAAYCWGSSTYEKTGHDPNSGIPDHIAAPITGYENTFGLKAVDLALTFDQTCVLFNNGTTRCRGLNTRNLLGCGTECAPTLSSSSTGPFDVRTAYAVPAGFDSLSDADRKMTSIAGAMSNEGFSMGFAATYAIGRVATWGWLAEQPYPGLGAALSVPDPLRNQTVWLTGEYAGSGQ